MLLLWQSPSKDRAMLWSPPRLQRRVSVMQCAEQTGEKDKQMWDESLESQVHLLPSEDRRIPVRQATAAPDARSFELRSENLCLRTKILSSHKRWPWGFISPVVIYNKCSFCIWPQGARKCLFLLQMKSSHLHLSPLCFIFYKYVICVQFKCRWQIAEKIPLYSINDF